MGKMQYLVTDAGQLTVDVRDSPLTCLVQVLDRSQGVGTPEKRAALWYCASTAVSGTLVVPVRLCVQLGWAR